MNKTIKRLTSLLLVLIITTTCSVTVFARFQEIMDASCSVTISSSGYASSSATCSTWDLKSKIVMTVYLQQSADGHSWTTYADYGSATGYGDLNRSCGIYVYKNYYYRTRFMVSVYDSNGNLLDAEAFNSSMKWYS